jgi:MFS family permease
MRMTIPQSEALVTAQLGRSSQDSLESAAVLEAWGGVSSPFALELAHEQFSSDHVRTLKRGHSIPWRVQPTSPSHALGLLLTILVTAAWLTPPNSVHEVRTAWLIAIPVMQLLLGILHRRYLGTSSDLARLRVGAVRTATIFVSMLLIVSTFGPSGPLAACMICIWICSVVVVYRGWGIPYAAISGATAILCEHYAAQQIVQIMVLLSAVSASIAIVTTEPSQHKPAPLTRVIPTAIYSAALGFLIVLVFTGLEHIRTNFFVLSLVPTFTAGYWSSRQLWKFWRILPETMRKTPLDKADSLSAISWRLFTTTMVRYLLGVIAGSIALLTIAAATDNQPSQLLPILSTLAVLGCIALFAQILDGFGHPFYAAAGLLSALAIAVFFQFGLHVGEFASMSAGLVAMIVATHEKILDIFNKPVFTLARPY